MNLRKLFIIFNITLLVGLIIARSCNSIDNRYKGYERYSKPKKRRNYPSTSLNKNNPNPQKNNNLTLQKNEVPHQQFLISETRLCSPKLYEDCQACYNNCSDENQALTDINKSLLNDQSKYNATTPNEVYENLLSLKEKIIQKYEKNSEEFNNFNNRINNDAKIICYTSEHLCDINKDIFELSESEKTQLLESKSFIELEDNDQKTMEKFTQAIKYFKENELGLISESKWDNYSYNEEEANEGQEIAMNERMEGNNKINNEIQITNNYFLQNKIKREEFIDEMLTPQEE